MQKVNRVEVSSQVIIGDDIPVLIAGPCVIESESMILRHAESIARISGQLGMPFVFKASYDKANRTSIKSYRGPGLEEGLRILERTRNECGTLILTDVHTPTEIDYISEVVDIIQIPAFLSRQTDMLSIAARTGKPVNVKKGQFLAPDDIQFIVEKIESAGGSKIIITERGSSFGYHRLVVDFTGIIQMRGYGWPVVFDATHSVQLPGGSDGKSGGNGNYAPYLAWAAAAVGVDGIFIETHEKPDEALSDGPNMIPLSLLYDVLSRFLDIAINLKNKNKD